MIRRLHRTLVVGLVGVLFAVSACGSDDDGGDDPGTSGGDKLSIGVIDIDYSQLFSQQQRPGIKKALEDKGWEVSFIDSGGDPAKAISGIQNLIQKQVDAIVVQSYAADQLTAGISAANQAKIPVFSTGGGEVGKGMDGAIVYNGAEPINEAITETFKDKKDVRLLQLGYTPGAPCRARSEELNKRLEAMPQVKSTKRELKFPGADQTSQQATSGWLQNNPEGADVHLAVWLCTSNGLAGVLAAEAQLKRGPYDLFTWDFSEPAVKAVKDGTVTGVLYLPADKTGVQLADLIAEREEAGDSWEPKSVLAEAVVVNKDNVAEYENAK